MRHFFSIFTCCLFLLLLPKAGNTQSSDKNWFIDGYIKGLQNTWIQDFDGEWITWNNLHNRLNFTYFPSEQFSTAISLRNELQYGELIKRTPNYEKILQTDNGLADLTWVPAHAQSYVLQTNIDRAWIDYTANQLQVRVGRQRINWGVGLVWNPNDIFNSFSYFDFDYEERPGSDAVKLEYYTGMSSSAQLVCKIDAQEQLTLAGMYRFNHWNYDMQLLGGQMNDKWVLGGGWAGQIQGGGFRGEFTWFIPNQGKARFIASIDGDYTFPNTLYLHAALLYNNLGTTGKAGRGLFMDIKDLSPETLTTARASLFGQVGGQLTSLIRGDLSGMLNPYDGSSFIGPSFSLSLTDNLSFLLMAQIFSGKTGTEFGDFGKLAYIRLKWNF